MSDRDGQERIDELLRANNALLERARAAEALLAGRIGAAAASVLIERERQKVDEGWTPNHDDEQGNGQLARAAACYAVGSTLRLYVHPVPVAQADKPRLLWPWHADWWKPKTRRRDLERAGALIIAEIERIDRAAEAMRLVENGA